MMSCRLRCLSRAAHAGLHAVALVCAVGATAASRPAPSVPLDRAIERGVQFLVAAQNKDGSWGSARRTKGLNIFAPVPGAHHAFRCGTSALCVEALIAAEAAGTEAKTRVALERGEAWLLEHLPQLRRADTIAIYNVWGHAYGIQALAAMHRRHAGDPGRQREILDAIRDQIELLERYESVDGGWGYYDFRVGAKRPAVDSTSFVTATVLVAFHQARQAGAHLPEPLVRRAIESINRQKKPDHSYLYGEYLKWRPMREINRPAGSLGRSQACNLALRLWDEPSVTQEVIGDWLERLVTRNGWLEIGRKRPVPHEAWFQIAAYFFYYGHYYAAQCIHLLDEPRRSQFQQQLADLLVPLQEKDGSWWDFPFYDYHQPYGTAYALSSLVRCRRQPPP